MSEEAATGPIVTVQPTTTPPASPDASSFNLVACALGAGALTFTLTTISGFAAFALTLGVVALVLSIAGVATGRGYPWAGYIGIASSAIAILLGLLLLTT